MNIHQALHGYSDGHRLLASSLSLGVRDAKTVLIMSDASAPGSQINETGYLTGYPLIESGLYALARTWPAREMPRPGCVWTHTLFLDFSDLAVIESLERLCSLFQKPQGKNNLNLYVSPLEIATSLKASKFEHFIDQNKQWLRRILYSLYGQPNEPIFVALPEEVCVDSLILGIWEQQWPRLRRNFRFCSFTTEDRSSESDYFDLQVLPSKERSVLARFREVVSTTTINENVGTWLGHAIEDLANPNISGLRSFFRSAGMEAQGGRNIFAPLCTLHQIVTAHKSKSTQINEAVRLLNQYFSGVSLKNIRKRIIELLATHTEELTFDSLEYLLDHLDEIEVENTISLDNIGRALWIHDQYKMFDLLQAGGVREKIVEETLKTINQSDLLIWLSQTKSEIERVSMLRPEILVNSSFWMLDISNVDSVLKLVPIEKKKEVTQAMIYADQINLAKPAVNNLGAKSVLLCIADDWPTQSGSEHTQILRQWLQEAIQDKTAIADVLTSYTDKTTEFRSGFLVALAETTDPDTVPSTNYTDPWIIALERISDKFTENQNIFISVYLLSRAFGNNSKDQERLISLSFEVVYMAALNSSIEESAWEIIAHRLPRVPFWTEWDRCQRLRKGLIQLFIERNLSPLKFGELPVSETVFISLANEAGQWTSGRRFLRKVRSALKESNFNDASIRRDILKNICK